MGSEGLISPKSLSSDGEELALAAFTAQEAPEKQLLMQNPVNSASDGPQTSSLTAPQRGVTRTASTTIRAEIAERLAKLRRNGSGRSPTPAAVAATEAAVPPADVPATRSTSLQLPALPSHRVHTAHQRSSLPCWALAKHSVHPAGCQASPAAPAGQAWAGTQQRPNPSAPGICELPGVQLQLGPCQASGRAQCLPPHAAVPHHAGAGCSRAPTPPAGPPQAAESRGPRLQQAPCPHASGHSHSPRRPGGPDSAPAAPALCPAQLHPAPRCSPACSWRLWPPHKRPTARPQQLGTGPRSRPHEEGRAACRCQHPLQGGVCRLQGR